MTINDAGQEVVGGVPQTKLTATDIVEYWGAIVGSNSDGDVFAWAGGDSIFTFTQNADGTWNYSDTMEEDLEGRELSYVMEYVGFNYNN